MIVGELPTVYGDLYVGVFVEKLDEALETAHQTLQGHGDFR